MNLLLRTLLAASVAATAAAMLPAKSLAESPYRQQLELPRYHEDKEAFHETFRQMLASAVRSSVSIEAVATEKEISLRRYLAAGDFDAFNQLFRNAVIQLPNVSVEEGRLNLDLKGPFCQDIEIGDIVLSHNMESSQRFTFTVRIVGLDLKCYSDYDYSWRFVDGSGSVFADSQDSSAETMISFTSPNFDTQPPAGANVDSCVAVVSINDLDFSGGFINSILNTFEKAFRGVFSREIEQVLCNELSSLGTTFIGDLLDWAEEELDIYLQPVSADRADPLYSERNLQVPSNIDLLDYQNLEDSLGSWVTDLLGQADALVGEQVEDPNAPNGSGSDLGVNVLMRQQFLDQERALVLLIEDLPFEAFDPVIFKSHDLLTETVITMVGVKIYGVDTFTMFDPLLAIGKYTLQNAFYLDYITVELDLDVSIKPSTNEDSVIANPDTSLEISESIQVKFGVDKLEAAVALLMAVDQDRLKALELGGLLRSENLLSCFASVVQELQLAGFSVSIENIRDPVLDGFVSPGIDRVISEAIEAVFLMYEPTVLGAMPAIFQGPFRDIVQEEILASELFSPVAGVCSWLQDKNSWDEFIDFRDLLLAGDQALVLGGSGDEPYGDIGHLVFDLFQSRVVKGSGQDGFVTINDVLVKPLTKLQSGVEGLLRFESDLVSLSVSMDADSALASIVSSLDFSVADLRVDHLDSIVAPISLIEPMPHPVQFWNDIKVSPGRLETLDFHLKLRLAVDGSDSPFTMNDEIDFSLSMDSARLMTGLAATVETTNFLRLPLRHVFDVNCWLALIPAPEIDGAGSFLINDSWRLSLRHAWFDLSGVDIDARCLSCSGGFGLLPRLLTVFRNSGAVDLLGTRIGSLFNTLVASDTLQTLIDRQLYEAPYFCPVSPQYNPNATLPDYATLGLPELTSVDLDTLAFASLMILEVGVAAISENHRVFSHTPADPLEIQNSVDPDSNFVDWADFGDSLGLGSLGNLLWERALDYIEGFDDNGNLRVNGLIEDLLLDGTDTLVLELNEAIEFDGIILSLKDIKIDGLNSFQSFDVLNPLGPQTLSNSLSIEGITIEITAVMDVLSTEEPPQEIVIALGVDDLAISIVLFAAIDLNKVDNLDVGSVMDTKDILACVLSTFDSLNIPLIELTSASLQKPTISGLLEDTSAASSRSIDRIHEEFASSIEDALPILLDTSVRKLVNSIVDKLMATAECPDRSSFSGSVDYRAMFGSGDSIYGNLPSLARDLVSSRFLALDTTTGFSQINQVVDSWTADTSGTGGVLGFGEYFIDSSIRKLRRIGIDVLKFAFGKLSVEHLNTVEAPVTLLEPNETDGSLLNNNVRIGGEPRPVRLSFESLVETRGDVALTSKNELGLVIDVSDADVYAVVLAKLGVDELFSMPLRRVLDWNCWLALFQSDDENAADLAVESLAVAMSAFRVRVGCLDGGECSSGLSKAEALLDKLAESGLMDTLGSLIMSVVEEVAESPYLASFLGNQIEESSNACAAKFGSPLSSRRTQASGFPELSQDAIQKVTLLAAFFVEIGAVAAFETHASFPTVWDPLEAQENLKFIDTEKLMNFTDFGTSIGEWADTLVEELRTYLEGGEDEPRINDILRSFFLDDLGLLAFNLTHVKLESEFFDLTLGELRLRYLDEFNDVTLLDMIGPQTIRNLIGMNRVRGELDLRLRMGQEELPLTVHMELENVQAAFTILLAINKDVLGDIELSQMLWREEILPCFFSAMPEVVVTELDFSASKITSFGVDGLGEVSSDFERLTAFVLENSGERIAQLMRPFFGTTIRAVLNNWFEYMVSERYETGCPLSSLTGTSTVDFRDLMLTKSEAMAFGGGGAAPYGDLFQWAIDVVKDNLLDVDETTGLSDMNKGIVAPLTRAQSEEAGKLAFPGDLFATDTRVNVGGLDALINLRVYDAFIRNLDTVGDPLSLLELIEDEAFQLSNTATIGKNDPVQVGFQFFISISGSDSEIRNDLSVVVDLQSLYVLADALIKLAEERFFTMPVRHLTNLNCWLSMMPAPLLDARGLGKQGESSNLGLTRLDASVARVKLNVTCNDCSSPGMMEFSELLSTSEAADAATDVANMIFDYVTTLLGSEFLQTTLDRLLNDAQRMCPSSSLYDSSYVSPAYAPFESPSQESSLRVLVLIGISAGSVLLGVLAVMTVVKCVVRRRHRRWIGTLEGRKVQALLQLQVRESSKEAALNSMSRSMAMSPEIPMWLRYGMPIIILVNIGFFLSGHLSLGATVNIEARLAEQSFSVKNFFEFSMLRSTLEIWEAGGKELAVMIFIFSVFWPYAKQLITLVVWFMSPDKLSISRRGSTLLWLDTLAKWSMVDIMTLIVTVAAFRISVQSPQVGFLPDDFYSLDLLVVPMWGLYANMIAQLISQLSSHAIVHYHRRIAESATRRYDELYRLRSAATVTVEGSIDDLSTLPSEAPAGGASPQRDQQVDILSEHAFARPHRGESDKLVVRRGASSLLVLGAASASVLVVMGCVLPSFSLEIMGMIGVVVESGQQFDEARTEHSVFTIIQLLIEQANFTSRMADFAGLGSLVGLLIFSVLIVPIVQSFVLLYLWFRPLGAKRRRRLAIAVEVLQAWQYAEVYLLSVIVASWQLGPVSDFMINTYCDNLKEAFAQMVYYGILKDEDAQCFRVETRIENASYILAAASVALALLNTFVMRSVTQYFRDVDSRTIEVSKLTPGRDGEEVEDLQQAIQRIKPVPVLFTDAFRWLLTREDSDASRPMFVAGDGRDCGIDGITREVPDAGADLIVDTMEADSLGPSPFEAPPLDDDDDDEAAYFEESLSYFEDGIMPVPRQPEILLEENVSHDAAYDSTSGSEMEYTQTDPPTMLSAISELTDEPLTDPFESY